MNRTELITTKIKALWALKERKAWPREASVAGELIRQYINALSKIPDREIEILLDSFFGLEQKSMPEPYEISAKWFGLERAEKAKEASEKRIKERESEESTMRNTLNQGAQTSYAKECVKLIKRKLNPPEHCAELKRISNEHNVPCPSVGNMFLAYPKWMREKYEVVTL